MAKKSKVAAIYQDNLQRVEEGSLHPSVKLPVSIRLPQNYFIAGEYLAAKINESRASFLEMIICAAIDDILGAQQITLEDAWKEWVDAQEPAENRKEAA